MIYVTYMGSVRDNSGVGFILDMFWVKEVGVDWGAVVTLQEKRSQYTFMICSV